MTPTIHFESINRAQLHAKLEGQNPTGSLKDRTARAILESIKSKGQLKEGSILLDASSGSFACALAFAAAKHQLAATLVVNSKISNENLAFLHLLGATIVQHGEVTFDGYLRCLEMVREEPRFIFTDQLNNPAAPKAHEMGTGPEILDQVPHVQAIVGSIGSGATLLGVARHLRAMGRTDIKMFGSVAISCDKKKIVGTYLEKVDYRSPFIAEIEQNDLVVPIPVTYSQAMKNVQHLAKLGILVGPQGGGVYEAACQAMYDYEIKGDIVMIMGDTLWRNLSRFE